LAKTRRDSIIEAQNTIDKCQACYDLLGSGAQGAKWFELGHCNARYPDRFPRDDAHQNVLLERSFFSFDSWSGKVSEANYLVYFGAIYFCLLVLMCILWFVFPWVTDLWSSPIWASFTVFYANLQGVAGMMGLHWFYRLYAVASTDQGALSNPCYLSIFDPKLVTLNMILGVCMIFTLLAIFLVCILALATETMHVASAALSAVFVTLYWAFILWWVCYYITTTLDWWVLGCAVAAGANGIEMLILTLAHPSKGVSATYSGL